MARRSRLFPLGAGALVLALVGLAVAGGARPDGGTTTAALDAHLGEVAWPDEDALTLRMTEAIKRSIVHRYPEPGTALRDAHPKSHGCVRAEFRVEPTLPDSLARGAFVPGRTYPAWIRFSNGSGDADRADTLGDARGMAIKLMGVPGDKILTTERSATTQDFVLINNPTFFADDPARYARLIERGTSRNPLVVATAPLALGWQGMKIARAITKLRISSPLETRYWSTVPYALGVGPDRQAVKYSARPCLAGTAAIPADPSPDYLREAMVRTLGAGDACFDFLVQARTGSAMSVEDPRVEWTEAEAPFVKVATVHIPQQVFSTPAQDAFGDELSFTPWHALPDHRPLGGVNRARRVVYPSVSDLRHERNGTVSREPTGDEVFP